MADVMVFVESNTTGTGRLFAQRARELGLLPLLLSGDAGRYPYVAELGIDVRAGDTSSPPAVVAACRSLGREHRVVGVTSSSELFIATAAAAARALGLPGEDPATLAAARDKSFQRERFAAHGLDSPPSGVARGVPEAVAVAAELGLPVVVKPVSRSGSIGVRRCDTLSEVAGHAAELFAATVDERGLPLTAVSLVESYLDGPEYSVELLDGEVRAVVAKHLDQSLGFLETGHDVPADVDPDTGARLADSARDALAALGLSWGAAHVELRVVAGRAYLVEVNPRLAGGMIPQAVLAATGQDLIGELIARTAGLPATPRVRRQAYAGIRFLVPSADGEVRAVPEASAVLTLPGVVEAAVTARPGRRIVRQGSFLDRLGYVIATGPDPRQAGERAGHAAAVLIGQFHYDTGRVRP